MSNISQFFSGKKANREFITGPSTRTWPVPPGVSELEIHVWGGGGAGLTGGGGGGGGGYSRAKVNVTPTDSLSITVGGSGESSTVSIPTQSPSSPIFGGAGINGCQTNPTANTTAPGGAGGVGIATLAAPQPQYYCFSATGGTGGTRQGGSSAQNRSGGGGGSAGSPFGNGKNGGSSTTGGESTSGANILQNGKASCVLPIQIGQDVNFLPAEQIGAQEENIGLYDPSWFNITENIAGSGGAGGGGYQYVCGPGGTYLGQAVNAKAGGFLAGGGGGMQKTTPTGPGTWCAAGGAGGIAGGGGTNYGSGPSSCGGAGAVIIYY